MSCSGPTPDYGWVRSTYRDNFSSGLNPISLANGGEVYTVNSLPPKAEMARVGQLWDVRHASGSAFTFVAALPTTRSEMLLYNGEAGTGKTYVIDAIWCLGITSMAAAGSISLIAQLATIAAPTDDALQLITGRTNKPYGGAAKRAVALTTMTANKWTLLNSSNSGGGATAQIGLSAYADVYGSWFVKPGDSLGVNVAAGTAAGTAIIGISWYEVQLNLG